MPCEELRKQPRVWGRSRARRFLLWAYEWRSVRSLIARLTLATCDELVPGRARSPSTSQCRPEAAQKYRIHDSMARLWRNVPEVAAFGSGYGWTCIPQLGAFSQFKRRHRVVDMFANTLAKSAEESEFLHSRLLLSWGLNPLLDEV